MRAAAILALALTLTACGSNAATPTPAGTSFRPGAFEPSLRVRGELPGRRVSPTGLPREVVRASVRELIVTGRGSDRLPFYVGRSRTGRLCVGTTGTWRCLRQIDAQPVFAFTLQGGHGPIRDLGAIVGIAAPDVRVSVERAGAEVRLPLRHFSGFAWAAFRSPLWTSGAPDALHFYDRSGEELSGFLDLAFSANPCRRGGSCTPRGKWHVIGDPWGDATVARPALVERAKRIALSDPLVRRLLAGRRYFYDPATAWSKCSGGTIGAIIGFHIAPATFGADWPTTDYETKSHTAYVQRVIRYKISNVTQLDVSVDTNRGKVVGVDPTSSAPDAPEPNVHEFTYRPIGKSVPDGGPDSGDCSSEGG